MPKFYLGRSLKEASPSKTSKNKKFFPSFHVESELPSGFKVGQSINGKITGRVVGSRSDEFGKSFTINVFTLDIKKGKVSDKDFEKMSDKEQDDFLEKERG